MTLKELIESKLRRESINAAIEYKKLVFFMSASYHESCKEILLDDMLSNREIQILAKKEIAGNCFKYLKNQKVALPKIILEYKGYVLFNPRSPEIKNLAHLDVIYTFLKLFSLSENYSSPNYKKWEYDSALDDTEEVYKYFLKDSKYLTVDDDDVCRKGSDTEEIGLVAFYQEF